MINKELLKSEIDNVPSENLEVLYKIIKALKTKNDIPEVLTSGKSDSIKTEANSWKNFINTTFASLKDFPIERGNQGNFEKREPIR